jgi:phosphatidylserine/phosphatidylglycerophosphate/cardiolipin synthase-like enzyme
MDDAELVGGVLVDTADPRASARLLTQILLAPRVDRAASIQAGLHPELVEVLRGRLGDDAERVTAACQQGAAWVLGRRSVIVAEPWDLVASLPGGTALPAGVRRTTGETLVQLAVQASRTLRLATPFIDQRGLAHIADALAAATTRGVKLELLLPTRLKHADNALDNLERTVSQSGVSANFAISRLRFDAPWAHLKVLTADANAAYIGSANMTDAGIAGRNLELGVLVRGATVAAVEQILDLYRVF